MNINMKLSDNPSARSAYNAFCRTNCAIEKTLGILTSGLKINSSADDAAGLAISERMRAEMTGLERVMSNLQDGMSLLQTAEGGLSGINAIVQRMRELAVQSANDTLTQSDRMALQSEFGEIRDEIDRIADTTQFNRKKLLNGNTSTIWSSNNPNVKVIINGSITSLDELGNMTSAEGNYNVNISAKAGQSEVQKTGLFSVSQDYLLDSYYGTIGTGLYYDTNGEESPLAEAVQNFNVNGTTGTTYAFSIINADDSTDVVNFTAKLPTFSTPDEFVEFLNSDGTNDGNTTLYGTDYEAFYNATIDKFGIRSTHNFTIDDSAGGYQKLFGAFENQEVPESQSTVIYEPASAVTSPSNLSTMSTRGVRLMSLSVSGTQTITDMTDNVDITGTSTVTLDSVSAAGKNINIGAGANVTLNLNGTSTIGKITLGANSRLTIDGTGTLNGLIDAGDSGNITINGGTINAKTTTNNTAGIRVAGNSTLT
ncbi:MAG: hypothetical protein IJQ56_00820, partial [Synergistaceae bacterium]|nr:hypothetical protein [Synergistaceae bacterium]